MSIKVHVSSARLFVVLYIYNMHFCPSLFRLHDHILGSSAFPIPERNYKGCFFGCIFQHFPVPNGSCRPAIPAPFCGENAQFKPMCFGIFLPKWSAPSACPETISGSVYPDRISSSCEKQNALLSKSLQPHTITLVAISALSQINRLVCFPCKNSISACNGSWKGRNVTESLRFAFILWDEWQWLCLYATVLHREKSLLSGGCSMGEQNNYESWSGSSQQLRVIAGSIPACRASSDKWKRYIYDLLKSPASFHLSHFTGFFLLTTAQTKEGATSRRSGT